MSSSNTKSTSMSSSSNSSNSNTSRNNTSSTKTNTGKNYLNSSYFTNTKNNASNSNNRGVITRLNNTYQQNKTVFTAIGVISLVLVVFSIYYYYNYVRGKNVAQVEIKEVIDSVQDAQEEMEISAGEIPISKYSNEYGISMWFKIDGYTYRYGQEKVILKRGDEKYGTPEIVLAPKDNTLIVRTRLQHPVENVKRSSRGSSSRSSSRTESFADIPKKESFAGYVAGVGGLSSLDDEGPDNFMDIGHYVSNNEAPPKSTQYKENYFDLISGNNVNNDVNVTEGFQPASDTPSTTASSTIPTLAVSSENIEAIVLKFCIEMCEAINIDTIKQDANNYYDYLDENLNMIIKSSDEELKEIIGASSEETSNGTALDRDMIDIFRALMELEESGESLDVGQLVSNVNTSLEDKDCSFKLSGTNLTNVAGHFVRQMSQILKDSIYVYYYQLGQTIKDNNPELVSDLGELPTQVDECVIKNLPLQKWINLVISQYNQVIDVYLDGQLVSSCVLKGFPEIREEGVIMCPNGGFDGYISRLAFYNTALTQAKAYQIYRAGGSFSGDLVSSVPEWLYGALFMIVIGLIAYAVFM